ncbi:MAG: discoidin domain-containing protein [Verrucomicrobiales bacterium]
MTDQNLERLLRETLTPPPLGGDEAIESMLEAQGPTDSAYGQGLLARARRHREPADPLKQILFIAAILVLLAIPITIVSIAKLAPERGGVAKASPETSSGDPPGENSLVEYTLDYPEPAFFGTPLDIRLPNLEPAHSPRLSFTAPQGVRLISHNAKVTSSEPNPFIGELAMVTDGQKLGDDTHFVELPPGHQWIQIDLGKRYEIYTITLWHYHKKMRAYRDVVIECSPDESFSSGRVIVFNNDHNNSLGMGIGSDPAYIETNHGRIVDIGGIDARYVRLHSNGNTTDELNHYTEVEVYGR